MNRLLLLLVFSISVDAFENAIRIHQGDVLKLKCESLPMRTVYSEGTCYYTFVEKFTEQEALNRCKSVFSNAELVTERSPVLEILDAKFDDFHGSESTAGVKRALCSYDASSSCEDDEQMIGNGLCLHVEEKRDYNDALAYCRSRKSSLPAISNSDMNQIVAGVLAKEEASGGWLLQQTVQREGTMGWQFPFSQRTVDYFAQLDTDGNAQICKKEDAMIIQTLAQQCSTFGSWRFEDLSKLNTTVCIRPATTDFELVVPEMPSTDGPHPVTRPTQKPVKPATSTHPTNDILQPLKYFYNAWHIRHAFCADARCMHYINRKDVGFSPTFKKAGSLGRIVTHLKKGMEKMKTICPNGYMKLKSLSFHKTGGRYVANFKMGLQAGFVAVEKGVCGANVPIKEWGCRMSKDLMYGQNLEWNNWYKGLVRNNGKPVFWIWK